MSSDTCNPPPPPPPQQNGTGKTEANIEVFKELCANNATYFANDQTENGQRLYISFMAMKEELDRIWPLVVQLNADAHKFDFDESVPGNGYRSFINIVSSALVYGIHVNKKVCLKRESVLFRKTTITKEVEACAQLFASLQSCLLHMRTIMKWSRPGCLFATEHAAPQELIALTEDINQYCFYGRPLGFQFLESMRGPLRFITLSMVIFSEAFYNDGSIFSKARNSFLTTTKYVSDPEQRAKRVVNIAKNSDVNFCKAFWFLAESELMQYLPSVVAQSVAVCKVINVPTEQLSIMSGDREIQVPIPSAHLGTKPVHVRLISHVAREGMVGEGRSTKLAPPSRGLLIHCHGGGFVAQSSKSHETYLRQWAKELNVPILSIDYSLAPAAPYPRALEEVLYAYSWALKNCHLLGSTGERVVVAGDSAGANLLSAMTLKCIDLGIPKPHGLFLAYVPMFVNFIPSPARLLSKIDPLLPFGFLVNCIKAYVGNDDSITNINGRAASPDTESFEEISESDLVELQAHKSPTSEMSDTLTYASLTSQPDDQHEDPSKDNSSEPETSQRFDLLDKFVLDSDTDTDGTRIAVVTSKEKVPVEPESLFNTTVHGRVSSFVNKWKGKMSNFVRPNSSAASILDVEREHDMLDVLNFTIPNDPYISPYLASDEVLKQFPNTHILTVHLDPCLDDCVSFARKLKDLGNPIQFTILDGLPHGFLNFSLVCKEAYEASKLCTQKISDLLDLESLPPVNKTPN